MSQRNDGDEIQYVVRPLGERVSVLESKQEATDGKLDDIANKLDELLQLKYKGMGAIGLVSILVAGASGVAGVIAFIVSVFSGK